MNERFNSAQRSALLGLRHGVLRRSEHGWVAETERESRLLSDDIVRWMFGEGFLGKGSPGAGYPLTSHGMRAVTEAGAEDDAASARFVRADRLAGIPVLLIAPAPHSEELDYLLTVPLDPYWLANHRRRLPPVAELRGADTPGFEFVQFRDDLYALPITPRLAGQNLLPPNGTSHLLLENGLPMSGDLGAFECPDRGVNYGDGWLQWFGGFDSESPLIISERLPAEDLEGLLEQIEGVAR